MDAPVASCTVQTYTLAHRVEFTIAVQDLLLVGYEAAVRSSYPKAARCQEIRLLDRAAALSALAAAVATQMLQGNAAAPAKPTAAHSNF